MNTTALYFNRWYNLYQKDINSVDDLIKDNLDLNSNDSQDDGIQWVLLWKPALSTLSKQILSLFSADFITIVVKGQITGVVSQNCSNIDGIAPGTGTVKRSLYDFSGLDSLVWNVKMISITTVTVYKQKRKKFPFWTGGWPIVKSRYAYMCAIYSWKYWI